MHRIHWIIVPNFSAPPCYRPIHPYPWPKEPAVIHHQNRQGTGDFPAPLMVGLAMWLSLTVWAACQFGIAALTGFARVCSHPSYSSCFHEKVIRCAEQTYEVRAKSNWTQSSSAEINQIPADPETHGGGEGGCFKLLRFQIICYVALFLAAIADIMHFQ